MSFADKDRGRSSEIGIVGGSAAGLFTAHLIAQAGKRVSVLEGAEDFDPKPRTLIVTRRMSEILGRIGDGAKVNEIRRFELFTDGRVARIALRQPDIVVERNRLIRDLAAAARQSGAQVLLGRRFVSMEQNEHSLALQMERSHDGAAEELHVKTLVGADGAVSRVARAAGWPAQNTVSLVQAIVRLPEGMPHDTTRVWFIPDDTPYFYWLIPDSPTTGVLGLIAEHGPGVRTALERFLEKRHLEPLEYQAARVPIYSKWIPVRRQLAGGEVYLVGDAAGHVKVTTVGGIVTGFRGALGIAEAILNGGPGGKLRALKRELDLHLLIRKVVHNFTQAHYSHLVDLLNARARQDLEACTRDEPGRVLWRLCLHRPRLLLLGLRSFLTGGSFTGAQSRPAELG
jgi:flavin-dependent dehydrogenase